MGSNPANRKVRAAWIVGTSGAELDEPPQALARAVAATITASRGEFRLNAIKSPSPKRKATIVRAPSEVDRPPNRRCPASTREHRSGRTCQHADRRGEPNDCWRERRNDRAVPEHRQRAQTDREDDEAEDRSDPWTRGPIADQEYAGRRRAEDGCCSHVSPLACPRDCVSSREGCVAYECSRRSDSREGDGRLGTPVGHPPPEHNEAAENEKRA